MGNLFDLMVKTAGERARPKRRPKRRPRRSLAIPKAKRLPTPIVVVTKRKVKTKRSNRVEKVRAWEAEYGVRTVMAAGQ